MFKNIGKATHSLKDVGFHGIGVSQKKNKISIIQLLYLVLHLTHYMQ